MVVPIYVDLFVFYIYYGKISSSFFVFVGNIFVTLQASIFSENISKTVNYIQKSQFVKSYMKIVYSSQLNMKNQTPSLLLDL